MKKIRVLMGKVGLDGHDVGARVVARALADAGMEVVYTGLRQTPQMIVSTAVQENVDVIGISSLSGSHTRLFMEIIRLMKEQHIEEIPFIAGGVIPAEDIIDLEKSGVKKIFPPETHLAEIVAFVKGLFS